MVEKNEGAFAFGKYNRRAQSNGHLEVEKRSSSEQPKYIQRLWELKGDLSSSKIHPVVRNIGLANRDLPTRLLPLKLLRAIQADFAETNNFQKGLEAISHAVSFYQICMGRNNIILQKDANGVYEWLEPAAFAWSKIETLRARFIHPKNGEKLAVNAPALRKTKFTVARMAHLGFLNELAWEQFLASRFMTDVQLVLREAESFLTLETRGREYGQFLERIITVLEKTVFQLPGAVLFPDKRRGRSEGDLKNTLVPDFPQQIPTYTFEAFLAQKSLEANSESNVPASLQKP